MKSDQHEDNKEGETPGDKKVSSLALFFPEGLIALGLVLLSPGIAGFYFNNGHASQGIATLAIAVLTSTGFVICLSKERRWLAWTCMVGLIALSAMINSTVP